jgi:hypothetical protein
MVRLSLTSHVTCVVEQASRHCGNNGYWWNEETNKPWSDYRPCVDSNDFDVRHVFTYFPYSFDEGKTQTIATATAVN